MGIFGLTYFFYSKTVNIPRWPLFETGPAQKGNVRKAGVF